MTGALCSRLGTRGYSETPEGEAKSLKNMGMVEGRGLRGSRQSAGELMRLKRQLLGPICGMPSTLTPSFSTAVDFLASLP